MAPFDLDVLSRGCGEAKRRRLVVDGLTESIEVAWREVPEVERWILEQAEFDRFFDELAPTEDPMGVKLVVPRHRRGQFARYLPPLVRVDSVGRLLSPVTKATI